MFGEEVECIELGWSSCGDSLVLSILKWVLKRMWNPEQSERTGNNFIHDESSAIKL